MHKVIEIFFSLFKNSATIDNLTKYSSAVFVNKADFEAKL